MSVIRDVLFATCLFAVSACGQPAGGGTAPAPVIVAPQATDIGSRAQSAQDSVTAACGGGISGGGSGVTLTPDHHLIRWQKLTAAATRTEVDLGANETLFADIHRRLQAAGFTHVNYNQFADMTCSLTAGEHSVSWPQGDPGAPASVVAIHGLMMSASG